MTKQKRAGTFVVIEGPDASGKETQTGKLVNWLREKDFSDIDSEVEEELIDKMPGRYPDADEEKVEDSIKDGVWRLSFPSYGQTPGGRVVDAYLSGRLGGREELSVEDIVDIYAADRKQFKSVISEYLAEGGIVVCDRYREANLIHQLVGFEGEEWSKKLEHIKSIDADLPDADEIFYLNISPEEAARRMADKEKDIHELDDDYMRKSNVNGLKVARHQDWRIVDGERKPGKIAEELRENVKELISRP